MADVTLKVPADYREAFRAAVLSELVFDATGALDTFRKHSEQRIQGYPEDQRDSASLTDESFQGQVRFIALNAELVVALDWEAPGDVPVQGDPEAIYHALHELVSKFSGPAMVEALDILPPEPKKVARWKAITEWGLEQMANMETPMRENQARRIELDRGQEAA